MVLAFVLAQAFDLVTFSVMVGQHGIAAEANPFVVAVYQAAGLAGAAALKIGVDSIAVFITRRLGYRRLILGTGIVLGVFGGTTNLLSI